MISVGEGTNLEAHLTPPDFENIAGRGVAKKWRHTIRILQPDGQGGCSLGDWLRLHSVQLPSQCAVQRPRTASKQAVLGATPKQSACDVPAARKRSRKEAASSGDDNEAQPTRQASAAKGLASGKREAAQVEDEQAHGANSAAPVKEHPHALRLGPPLLLPPATRFVPVVCGRLSGLLLTGTTCVVLAAGTPLASEVDLRQFARKAGEPPGRPWTECVRLLTPDGHPGELLAPWLTEEGVDDPAALQAAVAEHAAPDRLPVASAAPAPRPRTCTHTPALAPQQHRAPCFQAPPQPRAASQPQPQPQPQPRAAPQPQPRAALQPPLPPLDLDAELMRLLDADMEAMLAAADAVGGQPEPGSVVDALGLMLEYLAGRLEEPPLHMIGVLEPPRVSGRVLDLRRLFHLVLSHGGYLHVTGARLWQDMAAALGHDDLHAGFEVRVHYLDYLHRFEDAFPGSPPSGASTDSNYGGSGGGGGSPDPRSCSYQQLSGQSRMSLERLGPRSV